MITLTGLIVLGMCWVTIETYGVYYIRLCTWYGAVCLVGFYIANGLDGMQGERIKQKTALNDLFKYSCDCCSTVFLTLITTYCLGVTSWETQWYSVQTSLLVLFTKHLSAFGRKAGLRYNMLTGPGEVNNNKIP